MDLRELMFEKAAPILETSGQLLAGVCSCGEIVPEVGPETTCPKCSARSWACLRATTYAGLLYVATDGAVAKFSRDGRQVTGASTISRTLDTLAAKEPYDRYLWLKAFIR